MHRTRPAARRPGRRRSPSAGRSRPEAPARCATDAHAACRPVCRRPLAMRQNMRYRSGRRPYSGRPRETTFSWLFSHARSPETTGQRPTVARRSSNGDLTARGTRTVPSRLRHSFAPPMRRSNGNEAPSRGRDRRPVTCSPAGAHACPPRKGGPIPTRRHCVAGIEPVNRNCVPERTGRRLPPNPAGFFPAAHQPVYFARTVRQSDIGRATS